EYVVKVNAFGKNSDVRVPWAGVRLLSEVEKEQWFEDVRRALDASYMEKAREEEARIRERQEGRGWSPPKGNEVDGRGRRGGAGRQGSRGFGGPGKGVGGAGRAGDGDVAARKFMETDRALFERDPEDAAFR
ncbi:unnamed protein product, partial [Sphacelaria rigidula]